MNIEVRIRKLIEDSSRTKALLSVTLEGKIAIHDIKLLRRDDGTYFIAMPSRKDEHDVFRNVVHPIGCEARQELEAAVIMAYQDYVDTYTPSPL